ncbi:MAG: amidase family protein [Anaerovoracaceae bacterium]|jgi:amidase
MRKTMITMLVVLLMIGGMLSMNGCKKESGEKESGYLSYDKKDQIARIDQQLEGLDIEKIRGKKDLIMEKSVDELQASIAKGDLTYVELTAFYLDRIKTYDTGKKGLNAVMEINPNAIKEAEERDKMSGEKAGVFGMPVLLKDNINTKDMSTSGGTYALKDFVPESNAVVTDQLIKNGAIILGKSNMAELANYMDFNMPNGYSSKAGQTINPFDPVNLTPEGSSSGSGAAVAANLAPLAMGTETTGSIIAPAAIHSIVGFKPTKDMISTEGVLPLSSSMDCVGPMTKNVMDAAILFNASVSDEGKKVSLNLDPEYLVGKRIGVINGDKDKELVKQLKATGCETVSVKWDEEGIDTEFVLAQDFKKDLNSYLTKYNAPVDSLSALIAFNKKDLDRRAKYGQGSIEDADKTQEPDMVKVQEIVKSAQSRIDKVMEENSLDAIVFADSEGVLLPATAGYSEITVPMGKSKDGTPKGATFVAGGGEDEKLLNIAYSFEQKTKARLIPKKYMEEK